MLYSEFKKAGENFVELIDSNIRITALGKIKEFQNDNIPLYVVSASIYEWVARWCLKTGFKNVISTCVERDKFGCLRGKFSTPNCYGAEKVKRIEELLKKTLKSLDKAAQKGVIKKNARDRKKSRLHKKFNKKQNTPK